MAKETKMLENRKGAAVAAEEKKPALNLVEDESKAPAEAAPKSEPRVLSAEESLRVEIVNLSRQNMNLEERLIRAQAALLESQQANFRLRQDNLNKSADKIFDDLGLTGAKVTLSKNKDGRYEVKTEAAP